MDQTKQSWDSLPPKKKEKKNGGEKTEIKARKKAIESNETESISSEKLVCLIKYINNINTL